MKNKDLIEKLQAFPPDMEVCIFDLKVSEHESTEEPSSHGVHSEFDVEVFFDDQTLKEVQEEYPEQKNWIALSFENPFVEIYKEEIKALENRNHEEKN